MTWYFKKKDILGLVGNLANAKASLGIALNATILVLHLLQLEPDTKGEDLSKVDAIVQESAQNSLGRRKAHDLDVGSVLASYAESINSVPPSERIAGSRFFENVLHAGLQQEYFQRAVANDSEPIVRSMLESAEDINVNCTFYHDGVLHTPLTLSS